MLKKLFTRAPVVAVLGAFLIFAVVASAGIGFEWPLLVAVATSLFAAAEGFYLWRLWRDGIRNERHMRQIRFIADRFQSMLRVLPGGYCLFTPQGLLREENGMSERLGVERISHMDDLIASIKEGAEMLEAFRKLQAAGQPFDILMHTMRDGAPRRLVGRRFRIGKEGPHVDLLWCPDFLGETTGFVVDPTENDSAEPAVSNSVMQETRTKDASLCDSLSVPVWGRDKDARLVFCNKAYAQALELTREAVVEQQAEILPAATVKDGGARAMARAALEEGGLKSGRHHAVIAGKRRLLEITETPFEGDETQGGLALLGCAIDVTAEEEKDAELKRHLAAHHEILEQLGAAIAVFGPDQRLEFYNRAYQRLWESSERFLDGKPTFSDVLEDLRARNRMPEQADFQKYKKERQALFTSLLEPREDAMFLPDGRSLRILSAPHPLGGLIFVYENVTDQLALETDYNTLMAVQRETIDHLTEGVALFGPDGRLRLSNPALARLWGYDETFLASGPHVTDMLEAARSSLDVDEDWPSRKEKMVSYALDRTPRNGRMRRTDDLVVDYLTMPLPDGSVLNSFVDVTDSVRVEEALRASNEALATADRLKSDFVANVSYQLRTPLNTITGFAEILAAQYFGKLNDRQLEYTTTIRAESEKLTRLINDVLDLATIEAGRMTLDRRPIAVLDLLEDARHMTAEWARQQSLEILIDCPSDVGTFDVDESRMKQVLFNLISNAIKYTPSGGTIGLAAWRQDSWTVVSVLDTGVGIPEEEKARLFDKFEKANRHLRQNGAGLGLSLVRSIVELHGGKVEIFSGELDGTNVICFLPQKAPAQKKTAAQAALLA